MALSLMVYSGSVLRRDAGNGNAIELLCAVSGRCEKKIGKIFSLRGQTSKIVERAEDGRLCKVRY
jgi:hypothetical protein